MAHRPRPPSALPAKPPPTPLTAPSKYPPVIPARCPAAAGSAPVDSRARSTPHNSTARARRPTQSLRVSAPLVLQLTHGCSVSDRSQPRSHSTHAAVGAAHAPPAAPFFPPAAPRRPPQLPAVLDSVPASASY